MSLARALARAGEATPSIVRILDAGEDAGVVPDDAGLVVAEVRGDTSAADRVRAVQALRGCDVVMVQHEYGIFGGEDGDHVISMLRALEAPAIVLLHTVLASPTPHQRAVLEQVAELASAVVVMTDHALGILASTYDVDLARVTVIPHGVAAATTAQPVHRRGSVPRVLTWGLLSPGKGIERGIRALALLRKRGVNAVYVIAGETHPKVRTHSGEAYREDLAALAQSLGVDDAVQFVDRYLSDDALEELLGSADAVLLPYDSHEQATSGVLVEAVAAGVPVVATAFPHAVELLTDGDGTGKTVPHDDLGAMTDALHTILAARGTTDRLPAGHGGTGLIWPEVAERYLALARRIRMRRAA
jgi:glycosyltransferase involved in cell wall biosynthesis